MTTSSLDLIIVLTIVLCCKGCVNLDIKSNELGTVRFNQIPVDQLQYIDTGRPVYISEVRDSPIYLYHSQTADGSSGIGRWVISNTLGETEHAMAYINSWAIAPFLIYPVSDELMNKNKWMIPTSTHDEDSWEVDESLTVTCMEEDRTIYFESSVQYQTTLTGFYMERIVSANCSYQGPLYTHIRPYDVDRPMFLFKIAASGIWLIGDKVGVDSGAAFVKDADAIHAYQLIRNEGDTDKHWNFVSRADGDRWSEDGVAIYSGAGLAIDRGDNVYTQLRLGRAVRRAPFGSGFATLRGSDLPMPLVGLGTGGLYLEDLPFVMRSALQLGYQLFDLAREYGNEFTVGEVLRAIRPSVRRKVFLESKVWPTDLGFAPTLRAVTHSTTDLQTAYVDLYLLHWPSCDPSIDWMHCHSAGLGEAQGGTWRESWRALERLYAEGAVMSIGVSNFDTPLLDELAEMATVLPHALQNWADHSHLDVEARRWCHQRSVVYQPYATLRNLHSLDRRQHDVLERIAGEHKSTVQAVSLQFFLQTGAAMIPRSSQKQHLASNLRGVDWRLTSQQMAELGWADGTLEGSAGEDHSEL